MNKGKTKDEVDFEKYAGEMTFKPKILKRPTPNRISITSSIPTVKV